MSTTREEKVKLVLNLYYNKGYTYRDLAKELKMSPNQIREIIKRNEEKNNAIANKKKLLSISSEAYRMFSQGRTNVQVAIKLDIPQNQVTQLKLEYWRLQNQNNLESLYIETKGNAGRLWKLYQELVIKRGMSLEEVAKVVDIALHELPDMETLLDEATRAAAMKQVDIEHLERRIYTLKEEEMKRKRMVTLSYHNYYVDNRENPAMKAYSYYPSSTQPSPLPYQQSALPNLSSEYRNEEKNSKEKEEIREVYEGDIAD
jgi:DNA-binding CsgD family transcriptional regulator